MHDFVRFFYDECRLRQTRVSLEKPYAKHIDICRLVEM